MSWSLDPIYDSLPIALLLVGLIVAMLFTILPPGVSGRRRQSLLLLRGLASVALALVLLRPALVRSDNRPAAATLAIAIDTSASMSLPSDGSESRWDQQRRALERLAGGLSDSDQALQVVVMGFDTSANVIGESGTSELETLASRVGTVEHSGKETDLSSPLLMAMNRGRNSPLTGVAVLSDGTQVTQRTEGDESSQPDPRREARLVGAMGVPIWTIPLGPPAEASRQIDLAIESLPETFRMFTGNESSVSFDVRTRGIVQSPAKVSLQWIDSAGQTAIAATRTVTPDSMEQTIAIEVPVLAPKPGQYRLVASVETRSGETITDNNSQVAFVDVREGGGRVLYVEGTPRLEQKDLRWALGRFLDLELTYRWIPRDTVGAWPIDLADDFSRGRYDVVILGDLHSAALGNAQLQELADSVGEGTALIMLGGEHTYSRGGYATTPLASVLPVQLDDRQRQTPGPLSASDRLTSGADPTRQSVSLQPADPHPITSIQASHQGSPISWSSLPPMPGANRWPGVRVAPGVQVLLQTASDEPMMVVGEYGRGRVAALAFDSTWTWRRAGLGDFHRRFWRQLILWSLAREDSSQQAIQLELSPRRFVATEAPSFTATMQGDLSSLPNGASLQAEVNLASGDTIVVPMSSTTSTGESSVSLTGQLPPMPAGFHRLRVAAGGQGASSESGETIEPAEVAFQVLDDTRELTASATDHALLRQMASATSGAGGQVFDPDQMDDLVELIQSRRTESTRTVIEKFRLGDGPLSGWLIFLLFAGALSVEWFLRRQWGLA
ncbi:putative transmembrane protein [Rhodopirellula islandica]|uniref:Transmembrane protein n=1 Tax=Rhodopirellula islandica TaxID=595434 RepID=A0A0J1B815_RHOIS|nr:glutamine amidotransferase [Rhodopirellula islandica]KLU02713.1 putative transmembrane protein [Rhodopirellula islandica]